MYLEDTDFDGKKDGEDTESLNRNGNAKNFSNMIEVQVKAVFTYYYNCDGNISSKVRKVDDDYCVNIYIYNGDKVKFLSNNNYHYGFRHSENCDIIKITLNDDLLIAYDYLDDGIVITTYGNGYIKSEIISENKITASVYL